MKHHLRGAIFSVLAIVLALSVILPMIKGQPLLGQPGDGSEPTHTPPPVDDTPRPTLTPSSTPVARVFAAAVFDEARTPTPELTKTPPPTGGDTPTPSATPAARIFAPAVFDEARTPTPFLTETPVAPLPSKTFPPP